VWRVEAVGLYAQLAVSGSDQRLVLSGRDLNRPFKVVGAVDHGTAARPDLYDRSGPVADRKCRLSDASLVEVGLLDENPLEKSGQKVMMRKVGATWSIERLFFWIAD
jgi:hypothetical protein